MGRRWIENEVRELVSLWKMFQCVMDINKNKRKVPIYIKMSKELNIRRNIETNKITAADCRDKIMNLKKQYRSEKKKMMQESRSSMWWAYHLVDDIIGKEPELINEFISNTHATIGTSTTLDEIVMLTENENNSEESTLEYPTWLDGPTELEGPTEHDTSEAAENISIAPEHIFSMEESNYQYTPPNSESYKLHHNNHLSLVLESLANDESFMDVTLTAQGQSIKAHKSVLSAVSLYFKGVLTQNPCQHPIIIMPRDIKFEELNNIVSYIYSGEITVSAEELASLMETAEVLQIFGLVSSERSTVKNSNDCSSEDVKTVKKELKIRSPSKGKNVKRPPKPKENLQHSVSSQILDTDFQDHEMVIVKEEVKDELQVEDSLVEEGCWSEIVDFSALESSNNSSIGPKSSAAIVEDAPPDSPSVKNESPPFACPHCNEVKRPLHALESHLSSKHPTKPSFICKNCARVFLKQLLLQTHCKTCNLN